MRVKLTNAVDEALVRRGQLRSDQVRVYEATALVRRREVGVATSRRRASRLGSAWSARRGVCRWAPENRGRNRASHH